MNSLISTDKIIRILNKLNYIYIQKRPSSLSLLQVPKILAPALKITRQTCPSLSVYFLCICDESSWLFVIDLLAHSYSGQLSTISVGPHLSLSQSFFCVYACLAQACSTQEQLYPKFEVKQLCSKVQFALWQWRVNTFKVHVQIVF